MTAPAGSSGPRALVALDVDGTVVDHDDRLSDRVRAAVQAAAEVAHVVIATGRSTDGTLEVLDRLGLLRGHAVVSNGAVTLDLDPDSEKGFTVAEAVSFDPAPALAAVREYLPAALYGIETEDLTKVLTEEFPPGELSGPYRVASFAELSRTRALRVIVRSLDHTPEDFERIVHRIGLNSVTYAVGWSAWLDIAPEGVSKATALETVRRRLDVPPELTFAVGDGRNDIEMLRWAAHSAAMGNALDDDVVAAADEQIGTVHDDGLAAFLDRVLIGRAA
ncbi:HAD-IIB family hydrolase [Aquipuribacter nitratireducens]|uniref:HAD family hydrolase n=1 Tax=Aquipuribacter nitratireducens TaxID=650104 RepID=A0ABW0GPJ6_9MICO